MYTGALSLSHILINSSIFSCLTIKQDWRYGAAWFEENLIDHDVHSNSGGWTCLQCGFEQAAVAFNRATPRAESSPVNSGPLGGF